MLGINLAGAEFGSVGGGAYGTNYIYPSTESIDYYASKGMELIRLPFLWERVQPTKNGALDQAELGRMDEIVEYAASKGMKVVLDVHNYGKAYGGLVGSDVPNSAFADLWSKLATHFKGDSNVIFGLMNEPHQQSASQWIGSANAAIDAIRKTGATQHVLVPGSYWDGAHSWVSSDNDTVVGQGVVDPLENYSFEVHQYLDGDSSGRSASVVSPTIGVERLTDITNWARSTGNKLFLGEFGAAQDGASLKALDNMLMYMEKNADVWTGATYWAGGPWWGDYMFSAEPSNLKAPVDKPQIDILEKYDLDPSAPVGGPIAPSQPAEPSPPPVNSGDSPSPGAPSPVPPVHAAPDAPTSPGETTDPSPTGSSVSIHRATGTGEVVNEGGTLGFTIDVKNAVKGQTFDLWHSNTLNSADFVTSLSADLAAAGLPDGVSAQSVSPQKVTIELKEGTYSFTLKRQVALDGATESTDQGLWWSGHQEQTDFFIGNATGGLKIGSEVDSAWVTDASASNAKPASQPPMSPPASTPAAPNNPAPGATPDGSTSPPPSSGIPAEPAPQDVVLTGQTGPDQLKGGNGHDRLDGRAGADKLNGCAGSDQLIGGEGTDELRGGDGADILIGGGGQDIMWGGAGEDRFVFSSIAEMKAAAPDLIRDFQPGDVIDLSQVDANTGIAGNQAFAIIGAADFTSAGQLRVVKDVAHQMTFVEGNVDGDTKADFHIDVTGLLDFEIRAFSL